MSAATRARVRWSRPTGPSLHVIETRQALEAHHASQAADAGADEPVQLDLFAAEPTS